MTGSRMTVGVALPQMATGLDRERLVAWCRGIDRGPFSSVSAVILSFTLGQESRGGKAVRA